MVKIIAGEVVQDDDPRALAWERNNRQRNNPQSQRASNYSNIPQQGAQNASPLGDINNKLRGFGIPDLNVAGNVIEPIFTVAAVLLLVFYGLPGLLIVAVIWFVMSRQQQA